MEQLPLYIPVIFLLTAALTVYLFYLAAGRSTVFLTIILIWLGIQTVICLNGFYLVTKGFPPRFVLLVGPALLSVLMLFILPGGKLWLNRLDIKKLTLLHLVRIPVELVLYWLFLEKAFQKS